jgi:uncharacterized protein (TIGR03435 family)
MAFRLSRCSSFRRQLFLVASCVMTSLAQPTTFEVATIKPAEPKATRGVVILPHADSVLQAKGTTLKDLIQFAFGGLPPDMVVGEPGWCDQARFDIVAKPDGGQISTREQYATMMQALLSDRFQLAVHRERRQTSVFLLEPGKGDAKMKAHQADDANPHGVFSTRMPSAMRVTCRDVSMAELARFPQTSVLRRPVSIGRALLENSILFSVGDGMTVRRATSRTCLLLSATSLD